MARSAQKTQRPDRPPRPRIAGTERRYISDTDQSTWAKPITRRAEFLWAIQLTEENAREVAGRVFGLKRVGTNAWACGTGLLYVGNWLVVDDFGEVWAFQSADFARRFTLDAEGDLGTHA